MLTEKEIGFLREELATAKNPLFFYDDDPDGLCSFLLLYRMHLEGRGFMVKSSPKIDLKWAQKVKENNPDKIFILDVPLVEQEFVDEVKLPVFHIDHHEPLQLNKVHYFNPRIKDKDAYIPTTRMAYQINADEKDLWIAAIGCLADWHLPDFIDEFIAKYPELLPKKKDLSDAVFKQPIGKLVRIFSFLLKGQTSDVRKSVKVLTRIKSPQEILNQENPAGRFLYKRFENINEEYLRILKLAKRDIPKNKLLLFYYSDQKWSFTADLANELMQMYPKKVILIARKKSGEMKCSLRAQQNIRDALGKALVGVNGYGGGHEFACGAVIKEESWDLFLENFKREIQ